MDDFNQAIEVFKENWDKVYENAVATPQNWQQQIGTLRLESINEIVNTIIEFVGRIKAPNGYAPTFPVAKNSAIVHLKNVNTTLTHINSGQYNHVPALLNHLVNTLMAINLMVVMGEPNVTESLAPKLAENISLIQTAQTELENKKELLEETQTIVDEVTSWHSKVQQSFTDSESLHSKITTVYTDVLELEEEIKAQFTELKGHNTESTNIETQISSHNSELITLKSKLQDVLEQAEKQQQRIDELLPNAASAGLASGFKERKDELESTKAVWFKILLGSTAILMLFSFVIVFKFNALSLWTYLLPRIVLGLPFIYLVIFSSLQYGHAVRAQEDYAFKEATSKAFAGYKDHMEYLAEVKPQEANSAMEELAIRTIETLSMNPLRVYGNSQHDATFLSKLLKQKRTEETEE